MESQDSADQLSYTFYFCIFTNKKVTASQNEHTDFHMIFLKFAWPVAVYKSAISVALFKG